MKCYKMFIKIHISITRAQKRTANATRKSSKNTLSVPSDLRSPFAIPLEYSRDEGGSSDPCNKPRKNRTAPPTSPVVYNNRPGHYHLMSQERGRVKCSDKPNGCSIPGIMASNPLRSSAFFPSDSQNEGESVFSGLKRYSSCAFRKKYIVRGFWGTNEQSFALFIYFTQRFLVSLTIPHFSNLLAAKRYHRAALRRAYFRALKRAA